MASIAFTIANVHIDPPGLKIENRIQAGTNIDGDVTIAIDDAVVFSADVNFVEFVDDLQAWKRSGFAGDYSFDSSDFEETGLVRFRRQGDGYVFDSCWLDAAHATVLERPAVEDFVERFTAHCLATVQQELGIDLSNL